jgi:hypothetical protein
LEPPLCVVSNWIIRVYTILVWNTISGTSNLDICCYHCLILTLIFHLKTLINFFFFFIFIIIIINSIIGIIIIIITTITITIIITTTTSIIIIIIVIVIIIIVTIVVVLFLFIIYTINLPVVRPRSCRVIYYFDTPALGRRHQSFGRVRARSNRQIKSYGGFESILKYGRPDILLTEEAFHSYPKENSLWKPLSSIQRSDQKLWPFWTDTQIRATRHLHHWVAIP